MKALVWQGPRQIAYTDVPEPESRAGEVVIDVEIAGICGSDVHPYKGSAGPRVPPLILGHEAVGSSAGSRVVVFPLIGCGACEQCATGHENLCADWQLIGMHRSGVFAERACVPDRCLIELEESLPSARAVLAEPLACCVGALGRADAASRRVLVLGCGPIGLLTAMLAKRRGDEVLAIDPLPERQRLAETVAACTVASQYSPTEHGDFDLAVDAAGFEATWRAGIESLHADGELVVLGLGQAEGNLPMATVVRRAIRVRGQFAYSRADFLSALGALRDRELNLDWIREVPLSEGSLAFERLADRPAEFMKVLLRP